VEVYLGGEEAFVMAIRDIEEGQSLTIDYGQPVVGGVKWCSKTNCDNCNFLVPDAMDEAVLVASSVSDDTSRCASL
jgi:hypothetical protein